MTGGGDRIFIKRTAENGRQHSFTAKTCAVSEFKMLGVFGDMETLGIVSVTHDHAQHVDHGWVHRYVLLINGVVLAERLIRSNQYGEHGGPIMSGAAEVGRVVKTVHKAIVTRGYTVPEVTGGEGHETI